MLQPPEVRPELVDLECFDLECFDRERFNLQAGPEVVNLKRFDLMCFENGLGYCPFYDQLPESERTPSACHPSKKSKTKSTQALQWFENNIPQPNAWRMAQINRGIETVQSYEAALRSITARSKPGFDQAESDDESVEHRKDALSVVKSLAIVAHASRKEAALYQCIAAFRTLVVLSICVYLEFIPAPSPTYLTEIQGQLSALEDHLRTLPYNQETFRNTLDPKFSIPGIVITVLEERGIRVSPRDVYTALGHGDEGLEKVAYKVLPAALPIARQFYNISFMAPIHSTGTVGDLLQVTHLLDSGHASVMDTDPYGLNATYVASLQVSLPMCRLLKEHGAAMDLTDDIGNTLVDNLIECALVTRARDSGGASLWELLAPIAAFADQPVDDLLDDYLEDHVLTGSHRHLRIDDCVGTAATSSHIDARDAKGRSTLAWATEFGMQAATKDILALGADPNQYRKSNGSFVPMLHSIIAASNPDDPHCPYLDIVSTLLMKGTDRDSRDHEDWTPWHVAASWNHYYMAVVLLKTPGQQTIDLLAKTKDGKTALELSTDPSFISKITVVKFNTVNTRDFCHKRAISVTIK
ncbi:hypothetical protein DV735_g4022, partial [Chaetothyriales sp. CBS 134920]